MTDPQAPVPRAHAAATKHLERVHAHQEAALAATAAWTPNVPLDAGEAPTDPSTEGDQ